MLIQWKKKKAEWSRQNPTRDFVTLAISNVALLGIGVGVAKLRSASNTAPAANYLENINKSGGKTEFTY